MKKVIVIGHYASFAGAGELVEEFRRRPDWTCEFVVDRKDEAQNFWIEYGARYWPEFGWFERQRVRLAVKRADLTLVAGTCSLDLWSRIMLGSSDERTGFDQKYLEQVLPSLTGHCLRYPTAVIVTDSHLLRDPAFWNQAYRDLEGLRVFAMPDLIPVIERSDVLPYWPPVSCGEAEPVRDAEAATRVGHSPSKAARRAQKGSDLIEEACAELGIALEVVSGLSHQEALERKRHFDLFIDQVSDHLFEGTGWHGGMGKSGIEALAMGCAVVTSGTLANTEPVLPMPPVVWTSRADFRNDLAALYNDPDRIRALGDAGRKWVRDIASPHAVVDHLLASVGAGS